MGYWFWGMVGLIVGAAVSIRNAGRNGLSFPVSVIGITAFIYCAFIGARALYVGIFYPRMFIANLPLAMAFWQETGTWLGAPLFGPIGAFVVLRIAKNPFWTNLGSFAPGLALGHAIARIGCLCSGCCYGSPTSVPWAIYSEKLNAMVHPTQVYSMIGELVGFVILQLLWRKTEYRRYLFPLYGMLLATHRFISEFFRGSDAGPEIIPGLRLFQVVCICTLIISLCIIITLKWKKLGSIIAAFLVGLAFLAAMTLRPTPESKLIAARLDSQRYLVITRSIFADQLEEWKAERAKEGFDVVVHGWARAPSTIEIKDWIREQTGKTGGICGYILIVGDCITDKDKIPEWHIPSVKHEIQHNQRSIEFITDSLYGDLNGDGCPDVPVGRLTVQDARQLKIQIAKILNFKYQTIRPEWFRAVIWMGAKGYNSQIRDMATNMTRLLPKWMERFIISADLSSVYSGYPPDQPGVFLEQLSRPAFLSFVVSHGSFRSITPGNYNGKEIFLCVEDVAQLKLQSPSGVMFLLGCDSGRFNMPLSVGPSLSEAFADHPGGPIGVVAATGATHPVANYFITASMIDQIDRGPETIGDFMLGIQRKIYREGSPSFSELAQRDPHIKSLMQAVPDREKYTLTIPGLLRHEVLMYNLIGDPSCKLKLPGHMPLSVLANEKGEMIISGETPTKCSKLFVERIKMEQKYDSFRSNASISERKICFEEVNQRPETLLQKQLSDRKWRTQIRVPHEYLGEKNYVRCIAIGREGSYIGIYGY